MCKHRETEERGEGIPTSLDVSYVKGSRGRKGWQTGPRGDRGLEGPLGENSPSKGRPGEQGDAAPASPLLVKGSHFIRTCDSGSALPITPTLWVLLAPGGNYVIGCDARLEAGLCSRSFWSSHFFFFFFFLCFIHFFFSTCFWFCFANPHLRTFFPH